MLWSGSLELVPLVDRSLGFLTAGLGNTPQDPDLVDDASPYFSHGTFNTLSIQDKQHH